MIRSCKYANEDGYPKEYEDYVHELLTISVKQFQKLSKMDFSSYFDIRQIKYRASVQLLDLYTLPLLVGNGHLSWPIIDPTKTASDLHKFPLTVYAENWQAALVPPHMNRWSGFGLKFRPVFLPLNIQKSRLRVRVKVRCVLEI